MEIIVLCAIYLVELACYQVGLRILFDVEQKLVTGMIVGIILPVMIGIIPIETSGKNVLVTFVVMGITFLTMKGKWVEKIARIAFILVFVSCLEDIVVSLGNGIADDFKYLGMKICTLICLFIILFIQRTGSVHKTVHINPFIYLIIGVVASSMMFCLAVLNYVKPYVENERYVVLCNILNVSVHVSIFFMVVFVIYIKNTHERMEQLLKTEQMLKETQISYYRQLLVKEENTRKYRHDMNNHLIYIQELLGKKRMDDALHYLENLQGIFKSIQNIYYVTGNEMVDAIMNYFFQMLPDSVTVKIAGKCPLEFDMDDTDICTIFSNILQNVVEEIINNELLNAEIVICIEKGKEYVEYQIKNSMSGKTVIEMGRNGLPSTSKADKKNHGIGLVNVKTAVERNRGKFSWRQEEEYFCTDIILPIKNTHSRS